MVAGEPRAGSSVVIIAFGTRPALIPISVLTIPIPCSVLPQAEFGIQHVRPQKLCPSLLSRLSKNGLTARATLRSGARFGVSATDLLAVRPGSSGLEARHIEVQVRTNAISYILSLTDEQAKRFGKKKTTDGVGRMMYYTTPSMLGSRRSFTPRQDRCAEQALARLKREARVTTHKQRSSLLRRQVARFVSARAQRTVHSAQPPHARIIHSNASRPTIRNISQRRSHNVRSCSSTTTGWL